MRHILLSGIRNWSMRRNFSAGSFEPAPFLRSKGPTRTQSLSDVARFALEKRAGATVLYVDGDIDIFNSKELETNIEAAAADDRKATVIVVFARGDYADCSCLSVLIRQAALLRTRLEIVAPPGCTLRRILDLSELTSRLPVSSSLAKAEMRATCGTERRGA
jgi:anti-anti-sigma factor